MGRQNALDRVGPLGDAGLLDHTRSPLERMRQSQQANHVLGRGCGEAFFKLQDSLRQPIKKLPRLDAEIQIGVLGHSARCSPAAESAAAGRVTAW